MISVSDAARFTQESISIRKFKPWWEIALDYLILALLLLTIFSWAKVISADTSGLLCVPINPKIGYSFNLAKYFNSRCAQVFEKKVLLYYPYLLFLQWLLLSILQKLWLKVPSVNSKFDSYNELFKDMNTVVDSAHCIQHDRNPVFEKLMLVLREKTFLTYIYTAKVTLVLSSSLAMFCLVVAWATSLDFLQANFTCKLNNKRAYAPVRDFVCNFKPAEFLYVTVLCNIAVLSAILGVSVYAFYWVFTKRWEQKNISSRMKYRRTGGAFPWDMKVFRGTKGYQDFRFCFHLMRASVQEKIAVRNTMKSCVELFLSSTSARRNDGNYSDENKKLRPTNLDVSCYDHHAGTSRDFVIVKYICDYLGMSIEPGNYSHHGRVENFYDSLVNIEEKLTGFQKQRPTQQQQQREDVTNEEAMMQVLQKIASKTKTSVVLVHCYGAENISEVFNPNGEVSSEAVNDKAEETSETKTEEEIFVCFIRPFYIHMTSSSQRSQQRQQLCDRQRRYAYDAEFRKTLQQEAIFKVTKKRRRRGRYGKEGNLQLTQEEPTLDCLIELGQNVLEDLSIDDDSADHVKKPFISKTSNQKEKHVQFKNT